MPVKVLYGRNQDGSYSPCTARPENRGKGRCNHVDGEYNGHVIPGHVEMTPAQANEWNERIIADTKNTAHTVLRKPAQTRNPEARFRKYGIRDNYGSFNVSGYQQRMINGKLESVKEYSTDDGCKAYVTLVEGPSGKLEHVVEDVSIRNVNNDTVRAQLVLTATQSTQGNLDRTLETLHREAQASKHKYLSASMVTDGDGWGNQGDTIIGYGDNPGDIADIKILAKA